MAAWTFNCNGSLGTCHQQDERGPAAHPCWNFLPKHTYHFYQRLFVTNVAGNIVFGPSQGGIGTIVTEISDNGSTWTQIGSMTQNGSTTQRPFSYDVPGGAWARHLRFRNITAQRYVDSSNGTVTYSNSSSDVVFPTATIDSVTPSRSSIWQYIAFVGHGPNPSACYGESYAWSGNGGLLSTAASFSLLPGALPIGVYTIGFWVIHSSPAATSDPAYIDILIARAPPDIFLDANPAPCTVPYGTNLYFEGHGVSELNITSFYWYDSFDGALLSTENRFQTNQLAVGAHNITFYAGDELGEFGLIDTGVITVTGPPTPTVPPISYIYDPPTNSVYLVDVDVYFAGYGYPVYPQTNAIVDGEWEDSLSGVFATGFDGYWTAQIPGQHIFRFRVQDDLGVWSSQSARRIYVDGMPTPHITTFPTSPQVAGTLLSFAGSGTAFLASIGSTVVAFEWESSIDGILSTASSFSTAGLSQGTHEISLRVRDNYGAWSDPLVMFLTILNPIPPPPPQPDAALDTYESSVRIETWRNQRTRRGVR